MSHVRVVAYVDERGKMRRRFEEHLTQSFDLGINYDSDDDSNISNNGNGDSDDVIDYFNDLTENDLFDNDDYTTNLVNQNKNTRLV